MVLGRGKVLASCRRADSSRRGHCGRMQCRMMVVCVVVMVVAGGGHRLV